MSEAPNVDIQPIIEKQPAPVVDKQPVVGKQSLIDNISGKMLKVLTPEKVPEFLAANLMIALENAHDMNLVPEHYGYARAQTGPIFEPNNPIARWGVDHIGDMWEVSMGFTALRIGFVAANEVLKKTTGKEIPDEACFWASLATVVTVKAVHSLGYISLFGIHDHMANPVPGMLFGQGVAAVVLAASHYAGKYHESIGALALRTGSRVIEGAKAFDKKMNALGRPNISPDIAVNSDEQNKT